jgi:hypothetical protein
MIKCYGCSSKPIHRFSDCLDSACGCSCLQEIYSTIQNQNLDDVSENSPKFLRIDNVEIKTLPDLAKEVTEFSKIDRREWLPVKKDKRFKRKVR